MAFAVFLLPIEPALFQGTLRTRLDTRHRGFAIAHHSGLVCDLVLVSAVARRSHPTMEYEWL